MNCLNDETVLSELYNSIFCGNEIEFLYNKKRYYVLPVWEENKVTSVCFGEAYSENEIVCYSEDELYNASIEDVILGEVISKVNIVWTNF